MIIQWRKIYRPTKLMLPNCGPWALPLQNGLSVLGCCSSHMQCTHTLVPQGLFLGHKLIHIQGHGLFQMSLPHCSLGYPPVDGCWRAEAGQRWRGSRPPCHLWPPGKKGTTELFKGKNRSAQWSWEAIYLGTNSFYKPSRACAARVLKDGWGWISMHNGCCLYINTLQVGPGH